VDRKFEPSRQWQRITLVFRKPGGRAKAIASVTIMITSILKLEGLKFSAIRADGSRDAQPAQSLKTLCAILNAKNYRHSMKYDQEIILASHRHSIRHRQEILASYHCGCFYCVTTFEPTEIHEWADNQQTALCPNCGIDSVIGDSSGYNISERDFLTQMHNYWF
jgi:hypothetical protein